MPSESRSTRRRRAPLSRERVLRTAVAVADEVGEVPSMRVLAKRLGVEAMSLYNHVSNKDDLLDGMIDLVWEEVGTLDSAREWLTAMRDRAFAIRAALRRHPWAIGLMEGRHSPGPANLQHHNDVLGCLRRAGFPASEAVHVYSVCDSFIYGFALQHRTMPFDTREEFAEVAADQVARFNGLAEHYPYLAEVVGGYVAKAGYDYDEEFEFGLELLLRGLSELQPNPS
jgi:AcrR family transcriptional regulator